MQLLGLKRAKKLAVRSYILLRFLALRFIRLLITLYKDLLGYMFLILKGATNIVLRTTILSI